MTSFLLDTNVVSETAKPRPAERVLAWIATLERLSISAITAYELSVGVERLPAGRRRRFLSSWLAALLGGRAEVLPFDQDAALQAAAIQAAARRQARSIEERDLFILSVAGARKLTVATRNVADFRGHGVAVYDPFEDAHFS